jgi:tRNA(Ile2) C34 agmatinyltransferase TiaS
MIERIKTWIRRQRLLLDLAMQEQKDVRCPYCGNVKDYMGQDQWYCERCG